MERNYSAVELIVLEFTEWLHGENKENKENIRKFNKQFSKKGLFIDKKGEGQLKEGTKIDDDFITEVIFYFYPYDNLTVDDIAHFVAAANDGPLSNSNYMRLALVNDKNGNPVEIEVVKLGKIISRFWNDGTKYDTEDVHSSLYKEVNENTIRENYNIL